eukprot:jgi/Chrzof1/3622/Cz13g02200.t1
MQQTPMNHEEKKHHKGGGLLHRIEETRAHQAGQFQQREMEKARLAEERLQQEAAGGHEVDARPGLVRVSDPETEHRAHGHRHGLMHNIEDKRAAQAGAFQQREAAKVHGAQQQLAADVDAGHNVTARPGQVRVD